MAGDNANDAQAHARPPQPNPALKSLDVMVGTWELKGRESGPDGDIHGRPTFEWMEGGFYLVQHVDIDYIGRRIVGTEYIGYDAEQPDSRPRAQAAWSCGRLTAPVERRPSTERAPRLRSILATADAAVDVLQQRGAGTFRACCPRVRVGGR